MNPEPRFAWNRIEMLKTRWAVTVDGAHIAYQDVGEGPHALVLIHGLVLPPRVVLGGA